MEEKNLPEVWLRGPVQDISVFLQPAAHALLQSREEIFTYLEDFPQRMLWDRPFGRASIGFHLQHLTGVLDRMLTYAQGDPLSPLQLSYLKDEGKEKNQIDIGSLQKAFSDKVEEALRIFKNTPDTVLVEPREVGRKALPSTVLGLYFHAAEHSQRHVGQILVTVSVLTSDGD